MYHGGTDNHEEYNIHEPMVRIRHDETGELIDVSLAHKWPVRKPRPVAEKLPGKEALITGQRVLDVLFAAGARLRVWIQVSGYKVTGKTDSLVETSIDFAGAPQKAGAVFSWGT